MHVQGTSALYAVARGWSFWSTSGRILKTNSSGSFEQPGVWLKLTQEPMFRSLAVVITLVHLAIQIKQSFKNTEGKLIGRLLIFVFRALQRELGRKIELELERANVDDLGQRVGFDEPADAYITSLSGRRSVVA